MNAMHACTHDLCVAIANSYSNSYILPKSVPHKSHFYSCACTAAWMHVAIKIS